MNNSLHRSEIVKHIIIANVIMFFLFCFNDSPLYKFFPVLSLYYFDAPFFKPWQLITHFFMHFDFIHIAFNMYAVYLFGTVLEQVWGAKKFIFFYFITGIIASCLFLLVRGLEYYLELGTMFPYSDGILGPEYFGKMAGASGAVFGLLAGFGTLFPNTELRLIFPPITLKAKYFVLIYIAIELYLGFKNGTGGGVAHFAHLSGALVGFLIVKYWQKTSNTFY